MESNDQVVYKDGEKQDVKDFLKERVDMAPTWPARIVRGDSREQIKEIALKAYGACIDEALKEPLIQNNLLFAKVPIILFYTGETENKEVSNVQS